MSDHSDNEFADNKKLSALYHAGSTARPPEHIDQAILAKARRSASSTPQRLRPSWAVPISMAAVLVLSISLVSLIHEEAPDTPLSVAHTDTHVEETETTEKGIFEKQRNGTITEKKILTQNPSVTDRQQPQKNLVSTKTEEKLTSDISTKTSDEMTPKSFQRVIPQPGNPSLASGVAADAHAEFSPGLKKGRHSENSKHCQSLNHSACLDSKKCSLVMNDQKALVCKHLTNHCDTGFSQRSDTKESCETKSGCVYVSGPCFCPPDIVCICDDGQPSQCRPQK